MSSAATPPASDDTWTIGRILTWTQKYFAEKQIDTPRLDAEVLLAAMLKVDRVFLYTHYDQPLTTPEREVFRSVVKRRGVREPVAYIIGQREFYGHMFQVTKDVLIPRPETEHIIETALEWLQNQACAEPAILDLCTGSGAIGITLALEWPDAYVTMTDLSPAALQIAQQNAVALQVAHERLQIMQGDLWEALEQTPRSKNAQFDIIISNPPYVEANAQLDRDVRDYEPALALFAGADGLDIIRRIAANAKRWLKPDGVVIMEMGSAQELQVRDIFAEHGLKIDRVIPDLAGHPRVVMSSLCA